MATKTTNLGLSKAELTDSVRNTLLANNENFDKIDNQITRLKANQPKGTANGTEIVVQDSAEMESKLKISGNSEQDSRSGKNIAKINETDWTLVDNAIVNKAKNSGSTVATINLKLGQTLTIKFKMVSAHSEDTSFTGYVNAVEESSLSFIHIDKATVGSIGTKTYTATEDCEIKWVCWGNANSKQIKFQLWATVDGNTLEGYEPYGAMPSPDYPSEIRSVKSKSDNLFDKSIAPIYKGGADIETVELDTGVRITTGGQVSSSFYGAVVYLIKDVTNDVGKTVRLKANMSPSNSGLNPLYNLILCDSNGGNRKTISAEIKESGIVSEGVIPTLTGTQTYLGVRLYSTAGGTSGTETDYTDFTNIMITIDSEIKNYQPYGYVPVEAKVEGKNLFDKNSLSATGLYLNSSGNDDASANYAISDYIEVEPNTKYTAWGTTSTGTNPSLHFYDENKTYISAVKHSSKNPITYTTPTNCKYIRESVYLPEIDLFMIEKGDIATSYEPYKTKTLSLPLGDIELRSTPDGTRDTFARVDGVWNKLNKINSDIFTDQSNIGTYKTIDDSEEYVGFNLPTSKKHSAGGNKSQNIISNRFIASRAVYNLNTEAIWAPDVTQHTWLSIKKSRLADTTDFTKAVASLKTWLATNPIQTDYVLDTPTYTPITDTALIQALDELESLILHKGYNRITVTSVNGVKAYLDLSYTKDINTVLNNIITKLGGL